MGPLVCEQATLLPLDACMGIPDLPQSDTGQASILTGLNVSAKLGSHYGIKPNDEKSSRWAARILERSRWEN
jgi:hypothetical protein